MPHLNTSSAYCDEMVLPLYRPIGSNVVIPMNVTDLMYSALVGYCAKVRTSEIEAVINKPVVWVGVLILITSSLCCVSMLFDLFSGFYNRRYWFPCRYFYLGAFSMTMATAAVKLSTDMTSWMIERVDVTAKVGSLVFMCTMITNIMPSLASTTNNKELLISVIGFAFFVITVIGNTWVECITGAFMLYGYFYAACLLLQLMIVVSYTITVASANKLLEEKYKKISKTVCIDDSFSFKKLKSYVKKYMILAETHNTEYALAGNALSFFSLLISFGSLALFIYIMVRILDVHSVLSEKSLSEKSVYGWTTLPILLTHLIGSVIGLIAPIMRWLRVVRFKSFGRGDRNLKVAFKVERYWIEKLMDWKESPVPFRLRSRKSRRLLRRLRNTCVSLLKGYQVMVVVASQVLSAFFTLLLCIVMDLFEKIISSTPSSSSADTHLDEDLSKCALAVEENMEPNKKTVKEIENRLGPIIRMGKKQQLNHLLNLLETSNGFEGVERFDTYQVEPLLSFELPKSWSLAVASLTCIAVNLPHIDREDTNKLFQSVSEGLYYVRLVEEGLCSASSELVPVQIAAKKLWEELDDNYNWLRNKSFQGKTAMGVLKWYSEEAHEFIEETTNIDNISWQQIVVNSLYRIAESVVRHLTRHGMSEEEVTQQLTQQELFTLLSDTISDVLLACYTNIPRLIEMKCRESPKEKLKANVEDVGKLLGAMAKILNKLDNHGQPSIDPEKRPFIDNWCIRL